MVQFKLGQREPFSQEWPERVSFWRVTFEQSLKKVRAQTEYLEEDEGRASRKGSLAGAEWPRGEGWEESAER